jgi:hypothetical protein
MEVQRVLASRQPNACTSQAGGPMHRRTTLSRFQPGPARAVRPASLAASARLQRFETGSVLCVEPALGSEQELLTPGFSSAAMVRIQHPARLWSRYVWSQRVQSQCRLRARAQWSNTTGSAMQAALPNPSIEGDVQGLAPLSAPHVKR